MLGISLKRRKDAFHGAGNLSTHTEGGFSSALIRLQVLNLHPSTVPDKSLSYPFRMTVCYSVPYALACHTLRSSYSYVFVTYTSDRSCVNTRFSHLRFPAQPSTLLTLRTQGIALARCSSSASHSTHPHHQLSSRQSCLRSTQRGIPCGSIICAIKRDFIFDKSCSRFRNVCTTLFRM